MAEPGGVRKAFANAEGLLRSRRADLAARQLQEILREHPHEANSLRLLGSIRLVQGDRSAPPAPSKYASPSTGAASAFGGASKRICSPSSKP